MMMMGSSQCKSLFYPGERMYRSCSWNRGCVCRKEGEAVISTDAMNFGYITLQVILLCCITEVIQSLADCLQCVQW